MGPIEIVFYLPPPTPWGVFAAVCILPAVNGIQDWLRRVVGVREGGLGRRRRGTPLPLSALS